MGGLISTVRNSFRPKLLHSNEYSIKFKIENLVIHSFYFPPNTSFDSILDHILPLLENETPTLLVGDFNCRLDQERGTLLTETLEFLGFTLLNDPTIPTYICHNGSSTIDLAFSRDCGLSSFEVSNKCTWRKHQPILITISDIPRVTNGTASHSKPQFKRIPDITKAPDAFQMLTMSDEASQALSDLTSAIKMTLSTPSNKHKHSSQPWFNNVCIKMKALSREAYDVDRKSVV